MKTPYPRCGIPRSEGQKLIHETSVWHRKFFHIQRLLPHGKALTEIAANLRCSCVLIAKYTKLAGSINPLNADPQGAAMVASIKPGPFRGFYAARLASGMRPEMARLTLARKIAAITLTVWKKGGGFDAQYLKPQTGSKIQLCWEH